MAIWTHEQYPYNAGFKLKPQTLKGTSEVIGFLESSKYIRSLASGTAAVLVFNIKVLMIDKNTEAKKFSDLLPEDNDLTMFTIQNLNLVKRKELVIMTIVLKRKVAMELLTTYLPTILLLLITFVTIFFDKDLFGDAIAVNLTIMLVMTTIFTSKIEELPPTSDMKMIDIWLIFCLVVPFLEVILRTAIECVNCSCHICEPEEADKDKDKAGKEDRKKGIDLVQGGSSGAWALTGAKVSPQQVKRQKISFCIFSHRFWTRTRRRCQKWRKASPRMGDCLGWSWLGGDAGRGPGREP